jgi:hypothetical protein
VSTHPRYRLHKHRDTFSVIEAKRPIPKVSRRQWDLNQFLPASQRPEPLTPPSSGIARPMTGNKYFILVFQYIHIIFWKRTSFPLTVESSKTIDTRSSTKNKVAANSTAIGGLPVDWYTCRTVLLIIKLMNGWGFIPETTVLHYLNVTEFLANKGFPFLHFKFPPRVAL